MVRREPASTGQSRKLLEKYGGLYVITERLPHDRYKLSDLPETQRTQKFYEEIVAIDSMKKYNSNMEEVDSNSDSESEEDTELQNVSYKNDENKETVDVEVEEIPG